jgi:membrane-associated phospholipid phosphatase
MWISYDESRGIADRLGFPLQVESVINMDKFLFFGGVPNVWLQERFYEPGSVRWYDVAGSLVYFSHFIVPPAVMGILYLANRREWLRFVKRFATTMFIACTMFIVLPTAPPWMAAGGDRAIILNELPPLRRPTARGWSHLGLKSFANAWDAVKGRDWANKVAALPSLHAGYALFVVAFFLPWIRPRWLKVLVFAWPLLMTAALVYFGEHYVVDALAGWAVVGISFLVWNRIEQRQRDRRLATTRSALAASR